MSRYKHNKKNCVDNCDYLNISKLNAIVTISPNNRQQEALPFRYLNNAIKIFDELEGTGAIAG